MNQVQANALGLEVRTARERRVRWLIILYPFGIFLMSSLLNGWVFGVAPIELSMPSPWCVRAWVGAGLLMVANHSWLMTTTELTRLRYNLHASPEEWKASRSNPETVPKVAWDELARHHNAHRNSTENTVYFALLALPFSLVSPADGAAATWLTLFGAARLGHTYAFLSGRSDLRGLFMTLTLLATYGVASYLLLAVLL